MRGIVFVSLAELKRRRGEFTACAVVIWAMIFASASFPCLITQVANGADMPERRAVFGICAAVIVLMLAICEYMLVVGRVRRYASERRALALCGIGDGGFCIVGGIQTAIIVTLCLLTALPSAIGTVALLIGAYNRELEAYAWFAELEGFIGRVRLEPIVLDLPIAMLVGAAIFASLVAILTETAARVRCIRAKDGDALVLLRRRSGKIPCGVELMRTESFGTYRRVTRKRLARVMARARLASILAMILPFAAMTMAMSFTGVKPGMSYVISTETAREPIVESLIERIAALDGVAITYKNDCTDIYERLTQGTADEACYSFVHFDIADELTEPTVHAIFALLEGTNFAFSSPKLNARIASLDSPLMRGYFLAIALLTAICGVFVASAVTGDYYSLRRGEVKLLTMLGVDELEISRLRFTSGMRFLLENCLSSLIFGVLIFLPMMREIGEAISMSILVGWSAAALLAIAFSAALAAVFTKEGRIANEDHL